MGIAYDYGGTPSVPSPPHSVNKYVSVSVMPWPSLFAQYDAMPRLRAVFTLCAPAPAPVTGKIHLTPSGDTPKS